jgi:uncharacterized membrane protein YvbJ
MKEEIKLGCVECLAAIVGHGPCEYDTYDANGTVMTAEIYLYQCENGHIYEKADKAYNAEH